MGFFLRLLYPGQKHKGWFVVFAPADLGSIWDDAKAVFPELRGAS